MPSNNNPFLDPPSFSVSVDMVPCTPGELGFIFGDGSGYSAAKPFFFHSGNNSGSPLFEPVLNYSQLPAPGGGIEDGSGALHQSLPYNSYLVFDGERVGAIAGWGASLTLSRQGDEVSLHYLAFGATVPAHAGNALSGVLQSGLFLEEVAVDWGDGTSQSLPIAHNLQTFDYDYSRSDGSRLYIVKHSNSFEADLVHQFGPRSSTGIVVRAHTTTGYIVPTVASHLPLDAEFVCGEEDGVVRLESAPAAILDSSAPGHKWSIGNASFQTQNPGDALSYRGGAVPDEILGNFPAGAIYHDDSLAIFLAVSGQHLVNHNLFHTAAPGYAGLSAQATRSIAPLSRAVMARAASGRILSLTPRDSLNSSGKNVGFQSWGLRQSFDGQSWTELRPQTFNLPGNIGGFGVMQDDYTPSLWFDEFDHITVMGRRVWLVGSPAHAGHQHPGGAPAPDELLWSGSFDHALMPFSDPALWKYIRACRLKPAGICRIAIRRSDGHIFAAIWHGAGNWSAPAPVGAPPEPVTELTQNQACEVWQEWPQGHSRLVVCHMASDSKWFSEDLTLETPWQIEADSAESETSEENPA